MHAVATAPAEPLGARRSLPQRWQPSLLCRQVGFRIMLFEACSAFTHYGLHARRVTKMTLYIVGFDAFVTSFIAPIATGRSDLCRVRLTPTEKPCLCTAHCTIRITISTTLHCLLGQVAGIASPRPKMLM